jgi:hypothetical protein
MINDDIYIFGQSWTPMLGCCYIGYLLSASLNILFGSLGGSQMDTPSVQTPAVS